MRASAGELAAAAVAIISLVVGLALCGFVGFLLGRSSASRAYQHKLAEINRLKDVR